MPLKTKKPNQTYDVENPYCIDGKKSFIVEIARVDSVNSIISKGREIQQKRLQDKVRMTW